MRQRWRWGIVPILGLGLAVSTLAEGQSQPRRPPRPRDDTGMDARMLVDLELLRDLDLLKQLDLLRRMDEIRNEPPPRPAGAEEKGKP